LAEGCLRHGRARSSVQGGIHSVPEDKPPAPTQTFMATIGVRLPDLAAFLAPMPDRTIARLGSPELRPVRGEERVMGLPAAASRASPCEE